MVSLHRGFAYVMGLVFAAAVYWIVASANGDAAEPSIPPGATSPDANVLRAELSNGLRVIVVRNTLAPVVATSVNYLVGSSDAPDGFPGMAHAQEHTGVRV